MKTKDVASLIDTTLSDVMVPKNVRAALEEAKRIVLDESKEMGLRISSAVYAIERVSDEPNLMSHTRMEIWSILSALESLAENENK